jgi:hypothetical protein
MTAPDNRGKAVSEVVIAGKESFVKGELHDGTPIEYQLSMDGGDGDQYIGRKVIITINSKIRNNYTFCTIVLRVSLGTIVGRQR